MVDPDPVQHARRQPAQHERVRFQEDGLILDAESRQAVDVEEPPVIDLLVGGPPILEAVVLTLEQGVESVGIGGHHLRRHVQPGRGRGVDGQAVLEVAQHPPVGLGPQPEFARVQHPAVVVAQDRHQDLALEL